MPRAARKVPRRRSGRIQSSRWRSAWARRSLASGQSCGGVVRLVTTRVLPAWRASWFQRSRIASSTGQPASRSPASGPYRRVPSVPSGKALQPLAGHSAPAAGPSRSRASLSSWSTRLWASSQEPIRPGTELRKR